MRAHHIPQIKSPLIFLGGGGLILAACMVMTLCLHLWKFPSENIFMHISVYIHSVFLLGVRAGISSDWDVSWADNSNESLTNS